MFMEGYSFIFNLLYNVPISLILKEFNQVFQEGAIYTCPFIVPYITVISIAIQDYIITIHTIHLSQRYNLLG